MPTKRETHPSDRRRAYLLSDQDRSVILAALSAHESVVASDNEIEYDGQKEDCFAQIDAARQSLRA